MKSRIMSRSGETVTVVRFSADKDEEMIVAADIVCLIKPVDDGKYENWRASLEKANQDILKGDILRRKDGSELQVLRSVTAKSIRNRERTVLDLKNYDRQEPPLQENDVDVSKSDLPEHKFHPIIAQKVWAMFLQGNYDPAVLQAFKEVEIAVRKAGNYADSDHGVPLMRKAFHQDNGNLTDTNQQSAERVAIEHLFVGAMGYCRNPLGHREVNLSAEEAVEMIFFASYLLRLIDSRRQPEEVSTETDFLPIIS